MAGNVVDFDEFVDRQLDREAREDLRAERDALIAFMQQSDTHVYFVKLALATYSEHVTMSKQYSLQWRELAREFWAD
jgi:hypothetical protein